MINCIDCGTENCPCSLAVNNHCITCTRLQGKDYCDCHWPGVCIYNEFLQNGKRIANKRDCFEANIDYKLRFPGELYVLCLNVGKGFALKCSVPGSFVFLQPDKTSDFYSTPISILTADINNGLIYLAIKNVGLKTKLLCEKEGTVLIRGVYKNGILGLAPFLSRIKHGDNEKLMIITKGIGFAPAVNLINFCWDKCPVDMVVDKDKICSELIHDFLNPAMTESLSLVSLSSSVSMDFLKERIEKGHYTTVAVLASEYYQSEIKKVLPEGVHFMSSNNTSLCCGEGICGACSFGDQYGKVYKACKCY